jgi:hypothetical protein
MKPMFRLSALVFGAALALVPAYSTTITTYSSQASWLAATAPGSQTVTFTGLAPNGGASNYFTASGVTSSGVEFIGYNSAGTSDIQVIDTSAFSWYNDGSGDALLQSASPSNSTAPLPYINIVLPANITSLGMDLWTTNSPGMSYSITVDGNQYTVPTVAQNTETFWGLTSDTAITSLQLNVPAATPDTGTEALLDNFSFGAADMSAAPEAGTYLLIGTGLIGLVILRKRLKPAKPVAE